MNWYLIISGVFAVLSTVGHLTAGYKQELQPMLEAEFDPGAKQTMHAIFHFGTAALVLSSVFLLLAGFGITFNTNPFLVVLFIAAYFLLSDLVLFVVAFTTGIKKSPLIPVWVLFTVVWIAALLGVL